MFASLEDFRFARWVKRLNRTTQILLGLLLVAGLNYVAARHYKRWDLTPNKRYSLSAETRARLDQDPALRQDKNIPLELIFVVQQDQLNADSRVMVDRVRTLLKEYEYTAANLEHGPIPLKISEVDPVRQTTRAKQLEPYSAQTLIDPDNLPQLIVKRGDGVGARTRALVKSELYGTTYNGEATDFRGENAITSAILDVVQIKTDNIYFASHGEVDFLKTEQTGLSAFSDALRQRNFKLNSLDLSSPGLVPENAKLVVIMNPSSTFSPEEEGKLRRYLNDKNGRVLIFLSPHVKPDKPTGLESLMREWGLESPNLMVGELDPNRITGEGYAKFFPLQDPKRAHKITEKVAFLPGTMGTILLSMPRPVQIDPKASEEARRQVHELLATSSNSFAVSPDYNGNTIPPDAIKGPIVVAAISERRASDAVDLPGGKLMVVGDSFVATNFLFNRLENPLLLLNSVNYLTNHENKLSIRPQTPMESHLELSPGQKKNLGWRLTMVPAAMAIFGLIVCWVRNRS